MDTQLAEKAQRADLKRQYKRRHRKGIGMTARMKLAYVFEDLYQRRTDGNGVALDRKWHPGKAWTRRRLTLAKSLRENEFLIIALA